MPIPEEKGLESTQETLTTEQAKESISSTERAELETLRKQHELSKNEIVTRDRKLTELQKEVKARMTAEEQAKMQADEERKEWLSDLANEAAKRLNLDEKHSALIKGNSKDEIKSSAENLESLLIHRDKEKDKTIKALEDKIKILEANGNPPASGQQTTVSKMEFTRDELKDPEARKLYNSTKGAYIKNE